MEIPLFEIIENRRTIDKVFYSMLGVARGGKVLLYSPIETGYSILFADTATREQRRGSLQFSINDIGYNDFYLSTEGILCAMLEENFSVKMVCWYTDRFIGVSP